MFLSAATWISLSKWPMLQTMARSFILRMCSMVMTSTLPVAGDEDCRARRRGVLHGGDLVALHRRLQGAQIGSISETITRQPAAWRSGRRRALADVAEARDHRHLARPSSRRLPRRMPSTSELAAAVEIVEFRLGHACSVDV